MIMTEPARRKAYQPPDEPAGSAPPAAPPEEMELVKRARKGDLSAYDYDRAGES